MGRRDESVAVGRTAREELYVGRRDEDEEVVRLLCPDVYDYTAPMCCIDFRTCASSGNTVIYNCSDLGLRVEFLICASVACP